MVKDVIDKDGCFLPFVTDYGYVDPFCLVGTEPERRRLVLAHELGHACDLRHRSNNSLMEANAGPRTRNLNRRQKATLRSSPRVTYL